MTIANRLEEIQSDLKENGLDGWLLYDFRRNNDIACSFLNIPDDLLLTRRFFYWIPAFGSPVKIVSAIEKHALEYLEGSVLVYRTWQEMEAHLAKILDEAALIAMEYSPYNALPYISKVDAGTFGLVSKFGVEIISSADLLQKYTSVWSQHQYANHLEAADILNMIVNHVWEWLAQKFAVNQEVNEWDVQQYIIEEYKKYKCVSADPPICAVNEHSANPHYVPYKKKSTLIDPGDFILLDLWCKKDVPQAVYADITRVGVVASRPTRRQQEIFDIVKLARDTATELVRERMAKKEELCGWEVDFACREIIKKAGYGQYFIHRTGHNIGEKDHGDGTHIDDYETHDTRRILRGTCFSIEPGIYLPGEFGIRLEYNVYIHLDGSIQVTGGIQESISCLWYS